jgi:transposase-like protein
MLDEITLRRLYLEEQRSIRAIAQLEQVPTRTVYEALICYHIPRRASGFRSPPVQPASVPLDEPTLRRLYLDEERSIRNIAALYQVSTRMVYDSMCRYRIPRRTTGHRRPGATVIDVADGSIDEATLRRLYEEEGQSIAAIAASVACAPSRIRNALVRWGIARRRRGRQPGPIFMNQEKRPQ